MGRVKKRKVFKKKKGTPKGYDSGLEYELHTTALQGWDHHPVKVAYVQRHTYEPDFRKMYGDKEILIEVKGRFRDSTEAGKYPYVRETLTDNQELIFIFEDANKPMPFARKRKDGTKYSHGDWAEKNNFRYYCNKKGLPDDYE